VAEFSTAFVVLALEPASRLKSFLVVSQAIRSFEMMRDESPRTKERGLTRGDGGLALGDAPRSLRLSEPREDAWTAAARVAPGRASEQQDQHDPVDHDDPLRRPHRPP
jgi:hypothetical protein